MTIHLESTPPSFRRNFVLKSLKSNKEMQRTSISFAKGWIDDELRDELIATGHDVIEYPETHQPRMTVPAGYRVSWVNQQ